MNRPDPHRLTEPFQLAQLAEPGEVEEVPRHILREQLGLAAAPGEHADTRTGWAKAHAKPSTKTKRPRPKSERRPAK